MKLSSSNGTNLAVEKLSEARKLIGEAFEIIVEINEGTYKPDQDALQFDFVSCSALSDKVDSLLSITKKLDKYVYQNESRR